MAKIPMGFRFKPTDEEIYIYLYNKVYSIQEEDVWLDYIKELNLYEASPSDLQGLSKEEYAYYFTRRITMKESGTNFNRKTNDGKGFWEHSYNKNVGQVKKTILVYYLGEKSEMDKVRKTNWMMHEYALKEPGPKVKVNDMMVLCEIYENKPRREDILDLTLQLECGDQQNNTTAVVKLPMGFRFSPTDEEIITYLQCKVQSIQRDDVALDYIKNLNIYEASPFDLQGLSKEGYTYFFTQRIAKNTISYKRKTKDGKGRWKLQVTEKCGVGTKQPLSYLLKGGTAKGMEQNTNWVMHEFSLKPLGEQVKVDSETVLCRVYERKVKGGNSQTAHEIDGSARYGRHQVGSIVINESGKECRQINEPEQSQHSNTTSTAEKGLDLTLRPAGPNESDSE